MLQFIMERNVLLYVLAAACAVGVISQMILKGIYDQLIRDTKNTGEPSGRFLMQLRQRFLYCTHLNEKVGDVPALIKKSLSEYRFWGMGLHQWKRFGLAAFSLALSAAVCGCAILVQNGADLIRDNRYFWLGALVLLLLTAVAGISDTEYREMLLTVGLTDYLENSGAVKDYSDAAGEEPEPEAVYGNTVTPTPIVSVSEGRRAKHRAARAESAAAETKAQQEKRELKEHLARARAGIAQTAAADEKEKDSRAELLRSMDPKEQERILKEVLREFLS